MINKKVFYDKFFHWIQTQTWLKTNILHPTTMNCTINNWIASNYSFEKIIEINRTAIWNKDKEKNEDIQDSIEKFVLQFILKDIIVLNRLHYRISAFYNGTPDAFGSVFKDVLENFGEAEIKNLWGWRGKFGIQWKINESKAITALEEFIARKD